MRSLRLHAAGNLLAACALLALTACSPAKAAAPAAPAAAPDPRLARAAAALRAALAPVEAAEIEARIAAAPAPFLELLGAVESERTADPALFLRADKERALAADFEPADLAALDGTGLSLSRAGHRLRRPVVAALLGMDKAAREAGVVLLVGSAYRSFAYQKGVFERSVAAEGLAETERSIAAPGRSQHQLGSALDFAPIDESFAETAASRWLAANAGAFGFSLSYPEGMTARTGYKWESWHFRYLGKSAAALEARYFGGSQQGLLEFLERY
ncbi:MAG: M15 family metallopeptidase [Spirochaetaceae bacterium]|nr:M15 family metallopeptidase [Spirochaetaceae bacterium]